MTSRLSGNTVRQLTPLIGGMARLIAQGSNLSDEQLEILMEASDVKITSEVKAEVQRWAKLLLRAGGTADENIRRAIGEALQQRGLPEATVLLAVATVAEAQADILPRTELENKDELTASVERLDLGILEVGQDTVANIGVRGGPGYILSESDQLTVEPSEFEGELTRVLITAKPLSSSGTLWTKIKLVTAAQSREIPVLARWEEQQNPKDAATEATGRSSTLVELEPAITNTKPGSTLSDIPQTTPPQQPDKKSSLLKYVVATILIAIVLVTLTLLWQRPKVYQVDVDYGTSITSRIESLDEELFECNDFQVPQNARDLDIIPEQIGQQTTIIKLIHLRAFGNGGGNITVEALLSEIDRKGFRPATAQETLFLYEQYRSTESVFASQWTYALGTILYTDVELGPQFLLIVSDKICDSSIENVYHGNYRPYFAVVEK